MLNPETSGNTRTILAAKMRKRGVEEITRRPITEAEEAASLKFLADAHISRLNDKASTSKPKDLGKDGSGEQAK